MIKLFILMFILSLTSEISLAQNDRCKLLPTLEAYMTRDYGDPSRTAWPPIPKDGPVCEKLRKDRYVYQCWIGRARHKEKNMRRHIRHSRHSLEGARNARADQVGGAAAKARSIEGMSRLVAEQEAKQRKAQADLALATPLRDKAELQLEKLKCRFTKPKPWER